MTMEVLARRLGPEGLLTGAADCAPFLVDWRGRIRGQADAVARPADRDAVVELVRWAGAQGAALVPQGGNTGLVGGSVPRPARAGGRPVVLVSLARLRRIGAVDGAGLTLWAGAGATLAQVHETAARAGLRFPLSLGAKGSATVGGLVSTNAGGTQVLRHGTMRRRLLGVEAVLADGALIDDRAPLLKDNRGYDFRQLFCGAEGTLGIVSGATLALAPALGRRAVAWVGVAQPAAALDLLARLRAGLGERVESFELMADSAVALVTQRIPAARLPLEAAWHVLVEAEADVRELAALLEAALAAGEAADAVPAASGAAAQAFWRLRESVPEAERLEGPALKNDLAVPVAGLPAFEAEARALAARRLPGARPLVFGHAGDGNLHWNLRPPPGAAPGPWVEGEGEAFRPLLHDLAVAHGGTISAEHGIGTVKRAELARLAPARVAAMRAIKAALDPGRMMNPGVLLD